MQFPNPSYSKAKVVVLQVLPDCSKGGGGIVGQGCDDKPRKVHARVNPLYAISLAPAIRAPRTRSQQPTASPHNSPSTCGRLSLPKHTITVKAKMTTRRIVSEKTVLERDDKDFTPKEGEKSNITPAVPA